MNWFSFLTRAMATRKAPPATPRQAKKVTHNARAMHYKAGTFEATDGTRYRRASDGSLRLIGRKAALRRARKDRQQACFGKKVAGAH